MVWESGAKLELNLLLDLDAAICTGEAHYQMELFSCIFDKLLLEGFLFSAVVPAEPLYDIHSTVQTTTQCNELPTNCLPDLQKGKDDDEEPNKVTGKSSRRSGQISYYIKLMKFHLNFGWKQ